MRLLIAAIADYANVSQEGKLNLAGVFDVILANAFPVRHPQLFIAMRLQLEYGDAREQAHAMTVTLMDQDGRALVGASGQIRVPHVEPGQRLSLDQLLVFNDVVFQRADEYCFVITWDGEEQQRLALTVRQPPQPAPPTA